MQRKPGCGTGRAFHTIQASPDPAREASAATLVAALRERLGPDAEVAWADGATADQAAITALATAIIARQAEAHGPRSHPAP